MFYDRRHDLVNGYGI